MSAIVIHPVEITETVFSRASTATYLNAAGVLVTAAVDERRPLFVGGVQTGWVSEPEGSTNLLLRSSLFNQAQWSKHANLTQGANITGPNGVANSAFSYTATATGGWLIQEITLSAGVYTFSMWARLVSGSAPTAGELLLVTGGSVPLSSLTSVWTRFSVTVTLAAGARTFYLLNNLQTARSVAIWGAQVEAGGLSSHIPTDLTGVSRAPEIIYGNGRTLVSTSAVETYAQWAPATSYAIGNIVMSRRVGRIFMNLVAGVDATRPESAPTRWEDIGPTNAMAMFDKEVGSVTTATDGITVVLQPGAVSGMALQELRNATGVHVEMSATPGGPIEFERFISLESVEINSFYDWYFATVEYRSDAQLVGLPHLATCEMRVTIFGNGAVGCGLLALGKVMELGQAQYGASIGIINKSVKTENKFGRVSIKKLGYARRMNYTVWTQRMDFNRILKLLVETKDDPCIFIVTDAAGLESLSAYGFYKDFNIEISYPDINLCSLQVEGLV